MSNKREKTPKGPGSGKNIAAIIILVVLLAALAAIVYLGIGARDDADKAAETSPAPEVPDIVVETTPLPSETPVAESEDPGGPSLPDFSPKSTEATAASNMLSSTGIMINGENADKYKSSESIDFGLGEEYTELEGIITFRGNNFRDSAAYGTANLVDKKFGEPWSIGTGSLNDAGGNFWSGNGWTGQPLIVSWPKETRAKMTNMQDWAKEKDKLTEVIYASMDGYIYFAELESGSKTREALYVGYTFKGAGALDPRGYPILYVGSGVNSSKGTSHVFVISLIDGSVMYEFGAADSFSLRGSLSFFDSSPLVDADTDQLIYPGENGILYIIKLNSKYDAENGTVSIDPSDIVKWRYNGKRSGSGSYWLGMESSAVIWRGHAIMCDNGGHLICLDLNTLEVDWVQDVLDDTNCTPVLELEDGHPYIYISTSFHYGWRGTNTVPIPIWKIDAVSGEIVWQTDYSCYSVDGTSGGVQGTLALGKNDLSDLIFVPVARTPSASAGYLVALNKETGEEIWKLETSMYSWSSPVAFYDDEGHGYLIHCTSGGYMYLLDGLTGDKLDSRDLGSNIEASAAVYNDVVVVGTRGQQIYGIKMS